MLTYINKNGKPIIRSCSNCIHFKPLPTDQRTGYCAAAKLMFAYTMEESVYMLTKSFCLCEQHLLPNEEILAKTAVSVNQKDVLKRKEDVE